MIQRFAYLALFLAGSAVQAQGSLLPVTFVQTAPLPGEDAGSPPIGTLISSGAIIKDDAPFSDKLAAFVALTESRGYADDPVLMQAATGVGLRWLLQNRDAWGGHEATVAQLLNLHASSGGVMFAEMVDVLDGLSDGLAASDLDRLRGQILAAYSLRAEQPCSGCDGDPFGFVVDPAQFQDRMRSRVAAEADRQRAAIGTVAGWIVAAE